MRKTINLGSLVLAVVYLCGCSSMTKSPVSQPNRNSNTQTISLIPAPWVDGEMMRLRVSSPQGTELGTLIYSAENDVKNGNLGLSQWRLMSQNYLTATDSRQYTLVDAMAKNFRPLFSQTVNLLGDFNAEYKGQKIKLSAVGTGSEIKKDIDVNGTVYDNEQVVYLVRRLPLEDGFKQSFKLFEVIGGAIADCSVVVAGKESIAAPAGTFDCFKINLTMHSGQEKPIEQSMWISDDERRYLVKYVTDASTTLTLAEVTQIEKNMPVTFEDSELNFAVTAPYDWRFYKHGQGPAQFVELLAPQLKAKAVLCILPAGAGSDPCDIARHELVVLKRFFKNYTVRSGTFLETTIGPLKAVQYIADFLEEENTIQKYAQPKEMVEYRTYIMGKDKVCFFVFRDEKDKFDGIKSEFDAIIQSFELKQ